MALDLDRAAFVERQVAAPDRLAALRATHLLDAPPEVTFDRLVALATTLLEVPVAVVSLVEPARNFILAASGLGGVAAADRSTPISHSFCKNVVADAQDLVVDNSREHPLVRDNPAVDELNVAAYAGTPLRLSTGEVLGSFCAFDYEPHHWTEEQLQTLRTLAAVTMAEIELRFTLRVLREQEERFRSILERVRAFAVMVDANARTTFVNDYFIEVTGWSREELIGEDWFKFGVAESAEQAVLRKDLADGTAGNQARDRTILTKSGEMRLVAWDNVPLRDAHGQVYGVAGIGQDVTLVRGAERLKSELIGIVSHELRGPLGAIRAGLRLVEPRLDTLDEKSQRMVGIAARNSERLERLVNDLLDIERIESGAMPMTVAMTDVARVLDEACEETSALAHEAGVHIDVVAPSSIFVDVDVDRTVQAVTNLLRNAVSFSPRDSRIVVEARRIGDSAQITVRDDGRGIPADQLESIFERFKQVQPRDGRERSGTGLGLAICRAVVEQQGGRVSAESDGGKGSTFRIVLPLATGAL